MENKVISTKARKAYDVVKDFCGDKGAGEAIESLLPDLPSVEDESEFLTIVTMAADVGDIPIKHLQSLSAAVRYAFTAGVILGMRASQGKRN